MAMTVVLYVDRSSVAAGTPVTCLAVVSNGGAGDVTVQALRPTVPPGASAVVSGRCAPVTPVVVPAGGSRAFSWSAVFAGPTRPGATFGSYDLSCTVVCSDGTETTPPPVTIAVHSAHDLPAEEGQLRFDSNLNSGLEPVL